MMSNSIMNVKQFFAMYMLCVCYVYAMSLVFMVCFCYVLAMFMVCI